MQIHRVKSGETLYSISREYGVSPSKIAEINGLKNPDRLTVGRELLILFPKRTYTARRGDTLEAISKRFLVDKCEIFKSNPTLCGSEKIYPEEILSLGYCDQGRSAAFIEGYLYNGCPRDRLSLTLPYLSSLCVSSLVLERGRLRPIFNFSYREIKNSGKKINQRIYCPSPYSESDFTENIAELLVNKAKEEGASAITSAMPAAAREEGFEKFFSYLKERAKKSGISVSLECAGEISDSLASLADRLIITDSQEGGEDFYKELAERFGASKIMMDISPFASVGGEPIPMDEALAYTDERGIPLDYLEEKGELVGMSGAKEIRIPSLERIKAKLDLIGELGLLGAAIDIMRCPRSIIMMLSSLYEINPSYFSGGM